MIFHIRPAPGAPAGLPLTFLSSMFHTTWLMEGLGGGRRRWRASATSASSGGQDSTQASCHVGGHLARVRRWRQICGYDIIIEQMWSKMG